MAFKIIFKYKDGSEIKISNSSRKLTSELAEKHQNMYANPLNDGGTVCVSPYKACEPTPLNTWIYLRNNASTKDKGRFRFKVPI